MPAYRSALHAVSPGFEPQKIHVLGSCCSRPAVDTGFCFVFQIQLLLC